MNGHTHTKGFTLIEVLVSVAIIGILSTILFMSFSDARVASRDKALLAEVKEMQLAIELYKAQFDRYPLPNGTAPCGTPVPVAGERFSTDTGVCAGSYIQNLVPGFIADLPSQDDSASSGCVIEYRTDANGTWYKLTAAECIEGGQQMSIDDEMARCPSTCPSCSGDTMNASYQGSDDFAKSFAIYSLGGQCE